MECQLHRPVNAESIRSDSQTILRFPAVTDGKYKNHKDGTLFCVKGRLKGSVLTFPYKVETAYKTINFISAAAQNLTLTSRTPKQRIHLVVWLLCFTPMQSPLLCSGGRCGCRTFSSISHTVLRFWNT